MGSPNIVGIVAVIAVVALFGSPAYGALCGIKGGPKFQAQQQVTLPGPYYWQLSPCEPSEKMCPGAKAYVMQYNEDGTCNPNQLRCSAAPSVTKTSSGYTLNYVCEKTVNGEKDATVTVKCTSGPLRLTASGIPVKTPANNVYAYTFDMEGECSSFDYGWVFVIIVIVGLFVYFLAGFLFNFFVRKLRGLEAIPNIGFWKDLPGLIKDGFMFAFCRRRSGFKNVA